MNNPRTTPSQPTPQRLPTPRLTQAQIDALMAWMRRLIAEGREQLLRGAAELERQACAAYERRCWQTFYQAIEQCYPDQMDDLVRAQQSLDMSAREGSEPDTGQT